MTRGQQSLISVALAGAIGLAAVVVVVDRSESEQDKAATMDPLSISTSSRPALAGAATVDGDSSSYSITQLVTNNSSQTLSLTGSTVDNGGTITQSEASIDPHTTQVYEAINSGNGVQLTLQFTSTQGATFKVDTDVPRREGNSTNATVNGFGLGLDTISLGSHDKPQANIVIKDCTQNCTPYLSAG